jgi:hypothetical protein
MRAASGSTTGATTTPASSCRAGCSRPSVCASVVRCTLPVAPFGISPTIAMCRGTLSEARCSAAPRRRSAAVADAVAQHHRGRNLLAEARMRCCESDRLRYRRMPQQRVLDLARRDLLTAAVDQLPESTRQVDVTVVVDAPLVAGAEPAVRECRCVAVRIRLVARGHGVAADYQLADVAVREQTPGRVHHRDIRSRGAAHRAGPLHAVVERVARHLVRGLGHAVRLDDRNPEQRCELVQDARRQRGRRRAHEAQPRACDGRSIGAAREHRLMDRRYRRVPGRREIAQPAREVRRPEAAGADQRGARAPSPVKQSLTGFHCPRSLRSAARIARRSSSAGPSPAR